MKKLIKKIFKRYGYDIVPSGAQPIVKHAPNPFTMPAALKRCANRGVKVNTVIDVGASNGMWSEICMRFFPDATYLCVEAQEPHREGLEKFRSKHSNVIVEMAAAGNREGKIYFDAGDLFGGLASETPFEKNNIEVRVSTLDNLIKKHNLKPPFLIKLDTHGFEIPILEGSVEALKNTSLCVIEQYNYQLTDDSLRFFELSKWMFDRGFVSVDMVDLLLRKKDDTLWQMDVFYQPKKDTDFEGRNYQ